MEFNHISVLLNESVAALNVKPEGVYLDGTLGGGGHSSLICEKLGESGTLIGIDRDTAALNAAGKKLEKYIKKKKTPSDLCLTELLAYFCVSLARCFSGFQTKLATYEKAMVKSTAMIATIPRGTR